MKKVIFLSVFIALFGFASLAFAVSLEDWQELVDMGTAQLTPSEDGAFMEIAADSGQGETWAQSSRYYEGAFGIMATFTVTEASGQVLVGIRKYIGAYEDGTRILVDMYLYQSAMNQQQIVVKVREREADTSTDIRRVTWAMMGEDDDMWALDQGVVIGFALMGSDLYFYTPQNGGYLKIQLFKAVEMLETDMGIQVWTAEGQENAVKARVGNVTLFQK